MNNDVLLHDAEPDSPVTPETDDLLASALALVDQGYAPPREIYRAHFRDRIDWMRFPAWARPVDPEIFNDCCHEG